MSHAIDEKPFPRGVLLAATALLMFVIGAAATARITGVGATRLAPSEIVASRLVTFERKAGGTITARDAANGQTIAELPSNQFGFVGVVLQGIGRERMRAGVPIDAPLKLSRHTDGRTFIQDPETGQAMFLDAFGNDNHTAFAQLFKTGS